MNISRFIDIFIKSPVRAVRKEISIERETWRRKKLLRSSRAEDKGKDAIFLWVPKTAGTSLWHELYFYEEQMLITLEDINTVRPSCGTYTFGHFSIFQLLEYGLLDPQYYERAWKFSIVRNPYDRAVSLFEYAKLTGELPPETTFPIFCQFLADKAYKDIGLYNYEGLSQLNPQVSWLKDRDGNLITDFVGRYENLEEDANIIFAKLGIQSTSLPHKNPTEREPIQSYYSEKEINIIQRVYRDDFETFDYDPNPKF